MILFALLGILFLVIALTKPQWGSAIHQRLDSGKHLRLSDYVHTWEWRGILGASLVFIGLVASFPWWTKRLPDIDSCASSQTNYKSYLLVALAMLLGLWIRAPRLDVSVYVDEEHTIRRNIRGTFEATQSGELEFHGVPWSETIWENKEGNNPQLFSVLSRISLSAWRWAGGHPDVAFSETAFRMPCFVAGILTIAVVAWVLFLTGFPRAGVLAAFLLALHPWHIRYSAEGRGYALAMLFGTALAGFSILVAKTGRWRWWICLGVAQVLMLWTFPGTLYLVVATQVALVIWGIQAVFLKDPVSIVIRRWIVTNLVSGTVFLLGFLPMIPQLQAYLSKDRAKGILDQSWFLDFWSYLSTGMMWSSNDPGNSFHITISSLHELGVPAKMIVLGLLPIIVAVGLLRLASKNREGMLVVIATVLSILLGLLHQRVSGHLLYLWYLIFALPGVAILCALGVETLLDLWRGPWRNRFVHCGLFVFAAGFLWFTWPQTTVVRHHSKEPVREMVEAAVGFSDAADLRNHEIVVTNCLSSAPFYLPSMPTTHQVEELEHVVEIASTEGKEVFLVCGHASGIRDRLPEMWKLLHDKNRAELMQTFPGLEEAQFTHYLYKIHPQRHL